MNSKKILVLFSFLFLSSILFLNLMVKAGSSPINELIPPKQNPHPPLSQIDKKRVQLAEKAISEFLSKPLSPGLRRANTSKANSFQNKNFACLSQVSCYEKDPLFVNELFHFHELYGEVVEFRHPHVVPWSIENFNGAYSIQSPFPSTNSNDTPVERAMKAPNLKLDEYIVHVYVKFKKSEGWYHLDVILSEDKNGNIYLRHFFTIPMQTRDSDLPPGVVC